MDLPLRTSFYKLCTELSTEIVDENPPEPERLRRACPRAARTDRSHDKRHAAARARTVRSARRTTTRPARNGARFALPNLGTQAKVPTFYRGG
jgi:hypothetical protein